MYNYKHFEFVTLSRIAKPEEKKDILSHNILSPLLCLSLSPLPFSWVLLVRRGWGSARIPLMSPSMSRSLTGIGGRQRLVHLGKLNPRFHYPDLRLRWDRDRDRDGLDANRQKVDGSFCPGSALFWSPSLSGLLLNPVHHVLAEPVPVPPWCWKPAIRRLSILRSRSHTG